MSTTYHRPPFGAGEAGRDRRERADRHEHGVFQPLGGALRALGLRIPPPSLANARACAVRERRCPGPHLGELHRTLDAPGRAEVTFRVRNRSSCKRTYSLAGSAMKSEAGEGGGAVAVTPATLDLEPGEVGLVRVSVDAQEHAAGSTYVSRVQLGAEGCETQFLVLAVTVRCCPDEAPLIDLHCCCRKCGRSSCGCRRGDGEPAKATAAAAVAEAAVGTSQPPPAGSAPA